MKSDEEVKFRVFVFFFPSECSNDDIDKDLNKDYCSMTYRFRLLWPSDRPGSPLYNHLARTRTTILPEWITATDKDSESISRSSAGTGLSTTMTLMTSMTAMACRWPMSVTHSDLNETRSKTQIKTREWKSLIIGSRKRTQEPEATSLVHPTTSLDSQAIR